MTTNREEIYAQEQRIIHALSKVQNLKDNAMNDVIELTGIQKNLEDLLIDLKRKQRIQLGNNLSAEDVTVSFPGMEPMKVQELLINAKRPRIDQITLTPLVVGFHDPDSGTMMEFDLTLEPGRKNFLEFLKGRSGGNDGNEAENKTQ